MALMQPWDKSYRMKTDKAPPLEVSLIARSSTRTGDRRVGSDSLTPETVNQALVYNRFATIAVIINIFQFQFVKPKWSVCF